MTRRLSLTLVCLIFFSGTAWGRWDPKDKEYLVEQFRILQEQIQALKTQLDALGGQVAELRQNQQQFQGVMVRQVRTLQEMDQMVSSLRLGQEENFSGLRTLIGQVRSENEKAFASLTGRPAESAEGTASVAPRAASSSAPPSARAVMGYITVVEGSTVTVDLGSAQGIQPGARLAVYKAGDPNTRVGVLEVSQVVDAGNSRARVLTLNSGVQLEFSDIVRLE